MYFPCRTGMVQMGVGTGSRKEGYENAKPKRAEMNICNHGQWEYDMPSFDPQLVSIMTRALEDVMTRVPTQHSTPAAKAYLAECILKAAAQGQTGYDELVMAAADQIQVALSVYSRDRIPQPAEDFEKSP